MTSAKGVAPRSSAKSSRSRTSPPAPSPTTNPSRFVERPRGVGWVVIAGRQRAGAVERGRASGDGRLGPAHDHGQGVAASDDFCRLADRVGSRRTGRDDTEVTPVRPNWIATWPDDMSGSMFTAVNGVTRSGPSYDPRGIVEAGQAPDPGPDHHPHLVGEVALRTQICLGEGLGRGGHRELDDPIGAARFLGVHPLRGIEVDDLGGEPGAKSTRFEPIDVLRDGRAGQEVAPQGIGVVAERRNGSHPGDDDPGGIRRGWHTRA